MTEWSNVVHLSRVLLRAGHPSLPAQAAMAVLHWGPEEGRWRLCTQQASVMATLFCVPTAVCRPDHLLPARRRALAPSFEQVARGLRFQGHTKLGERGMALPNVQRDGHRPGWRRFWQHTGHCLDACDSKASAHWGVLHRPGGVARPGLALPSGDTFAQDDDHSHLGPA